MYNIISVLILFSLLYRLGFSNKKPTKMEWAIVYFSLMMITVENVGAGILLLIVVCLVKEKSDTLKYCGDFNQIVESFKNPSIIKSSYKDVKKDIERLRKIYSIKVNKEKLKEYFSVNDKQVKFNETVKKLQEELKNVKTYYEGLNDTKTISAAVVAKK